MNNPTPFAIRALSGSAVALAVLLLAGNPAAAQVSFGISAPGVSIGIDMASYPQLVRVPGYPVYYAPHAATNYFFYDGMYWVYRQDDWYASSWYNGPWARVDRQAVPLRRAEDHDYPWRANVAVAPAGSAVILSQPAR